MNPGARGQGASGLTRAIERRRRGEIANDQSRGELDAPALVTTQTAHAPSYRRKRAIALILSVLVVVAIPTLILALVLLG